MVPEVIMRTSWWSWSIELMFLVMVGYTHCLRSAEGMRRYEEAMRLAFAGAGSDLAA